MALAYEIKDAAWRERHAAVPAFTEELRALCEKYGFRLTAEGGSNCCGCTERASLHIDYGWPLAEDGEFPPALNDPRWQEQG